MKEETRNQIGHSKSDISFSKLSAIKELPPFPAVAGKLLSVIADEDADFRQVSKLIMTDTALSGQVVRLANSSLFGFRQEVNSVLRALCLMGANRVRDMVVTVALKGYMRGDKSLAQACWRHCVATALWGEAIAQWSRFDRPMAYTAGILHDFGRVALLMLSPDRYASFSQKASGSSGHDFRALERDIFAFDHCQVGGYLSKTWNFQPALCDVIAHHHDEVMPESPSVRVLVQAACTAASMSGFHTAGPPREWEPAQIENLLPRVGSGARLPLDDMQQKVANELNLVEYSLL